MCDQCDCAERNPHHGGVLASCKQCQARMIAHGPDYWSSERAGKLEPAYRAVLQSTFGESWQEWHETVKGWAKRIEGAKA